MAAEQDQAGRTIPDLPPHVGEVVRHSSEAGEELQAAGAADLLLSGQFGETWLVATDRRVLAIRGNGAAPPDVTEVSLRDIASVEERGLSGGKLIEVYTEQRAVPLVRYTMATAAQVAPVLDEIKRLVKAAQQTEEERPEPPRRPTAPPAICATCG